MYPRKILLISRRQIPGSTSGISISFQTIYVSPTVSGSPTFLPVSDASGLSNTSNTPAKTAKTVPIPAIVGGALGALVFILLLVLLTFLRRRRKKANLQTAFSPFESSVRTQQRLGGTAHMYLNFTPSRVLTSYHRK